ncbi:MAG TPA: hypothetical protein DCL76_01125 [Chloroflexi bacterium]|nr:hypothetical protein [Chloroflexota bacterium]|tara:strand:- start:335 stop:619 length:285 start_codon:yes stop_codon:yes gene_type:complete
MKNIPGSIFVYIIECNDNSLYTGWTTNLERRLASHNAGTGSRYTRMRKPVKLVFVESHATKSSAMKREAAIKSYTKSAKLELISSHQNIFIDNY